MMIHGKLYPIITSLFHCVLGLYVYRSVRMVMVFVPSYCECLLFIGVFWTLGDLLFDTGPVFLDNTATLNRKIICGRCDV